LTTDYYRMAFFYPFSFARFSTVGDGRMRRYDDGRRSSLFMLAQLFFPLLSSADYTHIYMQFGPLCSPSSSPVHYLEE